MCGDAWCRLCIYRYGNLRASLTPDASLRLPLPDLMDVVESGKRWQPRTPAMAAGLTDRVWSLREVLMYRVPPWPQLQVR